MTKIKTKNHFCPVCGYPGLEEPPRCEVGSPSYEICPSCGIEFGVEDYDTSYEDLRKNWLNKGLQWYSSVTPKPHGWDGQEQLRRYLDTVQAGNEKK